MTTEEIEKAVEEYTESLKSIAFENLSGEETPYLLRGAFKEGLESANKHWQEKTRWKSLEKEPPKFVGQKYQILVRYSSASPVHASLLKSAAFSSASAMTSVVSRMESVGGFPEL